MKPTTSLTSLLTRDLEVRSAGSSGRALLEKLEFYCFDLRGEPRPLEFAQLLQSDDTEPRQLLEQLLEWTAAQPSFQLVALVALAPDLDRITRRLGRGRPSDDTVAEVLAQATEALRWTEEFAEGERRDFVLRHSRTRTRGEQRRMSRHNVPTSCLSDDFDCAVENSEGSLLLELDRAIERKVITQRERELIEETRSGAVSLRAYATTQPESYDTLHKRRASAERRLRKFVGVEVAR
ncbi:MAG: hypothetical protein ACYDB2_01520 [Acidimicrobiales bacterium]